MKKYSNFILFVATGAIVGMVALNALLLGQAVSQTNLQDPFRRYVKHEVPPFRYASFNLGRASQEGDWRGYRHSHDTKVEVQSEQRSLYIHQDLKDSVQWKIVHDTLFVWGCNSEVRADPGVVLQCPAFDGLSTSIGDVLVAGGRFLSMSVKATEYAEVQLENVQATNLTVFADRKTGVELGKNTTADSIRLHLGEEAHFSTRDALPTFLEKDVHPTAAISLRGRSLGLLGK